MPILRRPSEPDWNKTGVLNRDSDILQTSKPYYVFAESDNTILVGPDQDRRNAWGWISRDTVIPWNTRRVALQQNVDTSSTEHAPPICGYVLKQDASTINVLEILSGKLKQTQYPIDATPYTIPTYSSDSDFASLLSEIAEVIAVLTGPSKQTPLVKKDAFLTTYLNKWISTVPHLCDSHIFDIERQVTAKQERHVLNHQAIVSHLHAAADGLIDSVGPYIDQTNFLVKGVTNRTGLK